MPIYYCKRCENVKVESMYHLCDNCCTSEWGTRDIICTSCNAAVSTSLYYTLNYKCVCLGCYTQSREIPDLYRESLFGGLFSVGDFAKDSRVPFNYDIQVDHAACIECNVYESQYHQAIYPMADNYLKRVYRNFKLKENCACNNDNYMPLKICTWCYNPFKGDLRDSTHILCEECQHCFNSGICYVCQEGIASRADNGKCIGCDDKY